MRFLTGMASTATALVLAATGANAQESATTPRIVGVEWPTGTSAGAPIPDQRLARINDTLLPVMIPPRLLNFRSFAFVGEELTYTASVRVQDATISITGTRIAADLPDEARPAAGGVRVSATGEPSAAEEGASIEVGMVRYGAAYLLTVECARAEDRRCANETYARGLLDSAEILGGSDRAPTTAPRPAGTGAPTSAAAPIPDFRWRPPGELIGGSGRGVTSQTVFAPGIRFPIEHGPAYLNSQVWRPGGQHGGGGSWSDRRNYAYPWQDNFCESRSRRTPMCPSGTGHQGVDIRPADPRDATHWVVAVENGRVSNVGTYSVTLAGDSGTQYRYLHVEMRRLAVRQGERVTRGQHIGLVSNDFNGTPTPVHLHFEILQNVSGGGFRHVPPYLSLVRAYERLD